MGSDIMVEGKMADLGGNGELFVALF